MSHHDVAIEIHHERAAGALGALDQLVGKLERMQIGAADTARQSLNDNVAGTGLWLRHRVDDEFLIPHDRCAHCMSSVNATRRSSSVAELSQFGRMPNGAL